MNLIIDIGNSFAKVAVFERGEMVEIFRFPNRSLEGLSDVVRSYSLDKGIVSSVITIDSKMEEQLNSLGVPLLTLSPDTPLPIHNLYKTPETLGPDRLAAVVGAYERCRGENALVIDVGTCITYDFIDASGRYHGGNISPGITMRFKALHVYTDRLPLVEMCGDFDILGFSTETAIRSGVMRGVELEIKGYIREMQDKYGRLFVFLTGGDVVSFETTEKSSIFADEYLVLKGLNGILNYNEDIFS